MKGLRKRRPYGHEWYVIGTVYEMVYKEHQFTVYRDINGSPYDPWTLDIDGAYGDKYPTRAAALEDAMSCIGWRNKE